MTNRKRSAVLPPKPQNPNELYCNSETFYKQIQQWASLETEGIRTHIKALFSLGGKQMLLVFSLAVDLVSVTIVPLSVVVLEVLKDLAVTGSHLVILVSASTTTEAVELISEGTRTSGEEEEEGEDPELRKRKRRRWTWT